MKKITVFVFSSLLVGVLVTPSFGFAEDVSADVSVSDLGVKSVGLLPTSPFYFTKEMSRSIQSFFTFNSVKKAELKLRFADEKLIEAKAVAQKEPQNEKAVIKAFDNYNRQVEKFQVQLKTLQTAGQSAEADRLFEKVAENVVKHKQVFDELGVKGRFQTAVELNLGKLSEVTAIVSGNLKESAEAAMKKAEERVARLRIRLTEKVFNENRPVAETLLNVAEKHLANAKLAFSEGKFGEAYGQAKAAEASAKKGLAILDRPEQEEQSSSSAKQGAFTGLLEVSGPNVQMWGTHKLAVETVVYCVQAPCPPLKKVYLVKAVNDKVLEKLKKYEGQKVTLEGKAAYINLEGGFWGIVAEEVLAPTDSVSDVSISYFKAEPQRVFSGDVVRFTWNGNNVSRYTLYVGCPEGVSVIFEKVEACGRENIIGHNTYISGRFVNNNKSFNSVEVQVELRAYDREKNISARRVLVITIVPKTQTSKIKIISPNGGETLKIGSTYEIKWDSSSNLIDYPVVISLKESDSAIKYWFPINFDSSLNNGGSYFWEIPEILTRPDGKILRLGGNTYLMSVEVVNPAPGQRQIHIDESDASFSIVSSHFIGEIKYNPLSRIEYAVDIIKIPNEISVTADGANKVEFYKVPSGSSITRDYWTLISTDADSSDGFSARISRVEDCPQGRFVVLAYWPDGIQKERDGSLVTCEY